MPRRPAPLHYVGYIRVSSERQAQVGFSLDGQTDAVISCARSRGAHLHAIHKDIHSGGGDPMRRPGLRDVVQEAVRLNCPILVTRVDRLARSRKMLPVLISRGIPVHTVNEGKITRSKLAEYLRQAEKFLNRRSRDALDAHAKKSPADRKKCVPNDPDGRRRGMLVNSIRAEDRNIRMFDIFDAHPELLDLSRKDLARKLNDAGHFNVVDQHGRTREWTVRSCGRMRNDYRKHCREQVTLDEIVLGVDQP